MFGGSSSSFLKNAYIHRVVRDETVLMFDAIRCWIYQDDIRRLGEVERALGGLTS